MPVRTEVVGLGASALLVGMAALGLVGIVQCSESGETRHAREPAHDASVGEESPSSGSGGAPSSGGSGGADGSTSAATGAGGGSGGASASGGTASSGGVSSSGRYPNGGASPNDAGKADAAVGDAGGPPKRPPSCSGLPRTCGPVGKGDCCETIAVPGGTFPTGRSTSGTDSDPIASYDQPEHPVTVSSFYLDKYEVTVGRFRSFVHAADDWGKAGHPTDGEGAHPSIPGSGWQAAWGTVDKSSLSDVLCLGSVGPVPATYTLMPGANESLPISCVSWLHAMAFCIWDGGRLPTEAEWEYAAAGGSENLRYPWGPNAPGADANLAVYGCYYGGGAGTCTGLRSLAPVGSIPAGDGRWGHSDLAGSLTEWVLDWFGTTWYSDPAATGTNVVNLTEASFRSVRGGWYDSDAANLRAAHRSFYDSVGSGTHLGMRCAR